MQKFKFRLEALLKYRCQLTEKEKIIFGQAIVVLQAELEKQQNLQNSLEELEVFSKELQENAVTVEMLINCSNYHQYLKMNLLKQQDKVYLAEQHLERCRKQLVEALKQQKLVEKIKEKRLAQYQSELLRLVQQELDEIGIQRFNREM